MASSLASVVASPLFTKAAILQALKSDAGMRTAWIIVEAEEDYNVYNGFMNPATTVVKTSEGDDGRRGYANVELIVTDVKAAVPAAHICGVRDADYTKYEDTPHTFTDNVFITDRRDVEMMMLEADSVQTVLKAWLPDFDTAFARCILICRHLGYLQIINHIEGLECVFRKHMKVSRFWNQLEHTLVSDWKKQCNQTFYCLTEGAGTEFHINHFIIEKSLTGENFYDVCRGHDVLAVLSLSSVNTNIFSPAAIMRKMIETYTFDDFKTTKLYASLKEWQNAERVIALVA